MELDPPTPIPKLSDMSKLKRSYILAELAKIAYDNLEEVAQKAKELGFKLVEFYEQETAQGYRFVSDHDIVIACRGAETKAEEIEDMFAYFKIQRVSAGTDDAHVPGLVHSGFRAEACRLWDAIQKDILAETDGEIHKLWFTGHSLGAAMSTLLAVYSQQTEDALDTAGLVTFGSPRVGNWTFAKFANGAVPEYLRWVNNEDIFTKYPLNLLGYYHCGHAMYLKEDGTCLEDVSWLKIFVDRTLGRLYHIYHLFRFGAIEISDFSDHHMDNYLEKIRQLALPEAEAALAEEEAAQEEATPAPQPATPTPSPQRTTPTSKQRTTPTSKQRAKPASKQRAKPASKQRAKPASKQRAKPASKQRAKPASKQRTAKKKK